MTTGGYQKVYDQPNELKGNCLLGQLVDEGYKQQQLNGQYVKDIIYIHFNQVYRTFRAAYVGEGPLHLFTASEKVDLKTKGNMI